MGESINPRSAEISRDAPTAEAAERVGDPMADMTFPQVARLELDELIDQLVERARDVQNTQGRLRELLRAQLLIAQGVDLEEVLHHILTAARQLVSARYAALGVVEHSQLVRFVHTGIDAETVARIGNLPQGKGVLGVLLDDPRPVRLSTIAEHPAAVGFPAHHPPMGSFLGVPIRVREQIYGNLYLTEKEGGGQFTADDEELVLALGTAAGIAIDNAHLFTEARRRHSWQAALVESTTVLLSTGEGDDRMHRLAQIAQQTSDADAACVCMAEGFDEPTIVAATGAFTVLLRQNPEALAALAAGTIRDRNPVLITDPGTDRRVARVVELLPDLTTISAHPMISDVGAAGILILARTGDHRPFAHVDLDMAGLFASRAALALQLAAARHDTEQLRLLDDRLRIAQDLKDGVVSRLFGLGMAMQGTAARTRDQTTNEAITGHVDELDAIIRDIRTAVFSLGLQAK